MNQTIQEHQIHTTLASALEDHKQIFADPNLILSNPIEEIDSELLKIYAMDIDKIYGKAIQCVAMRELTNRTQKAINSKR